MRRSFIFDCKPEKFAVTELGTNEVELKLGLNITTKMSQADWHSLCNLAYTINFSSKETANGINTGSACTPNPSREDKSANNTAQTDWDDARR